MEVVIQGAVSALGFVDESGNYCPEPDCYETLRDLIRYLRTDSSTYVARRIIGDRNVVENDLIPLLKSKPDDEKMFDIIIRLMVNIVQPTLVTFMGKKPEDLEQNKICIQLENNLRKAKLAFLDPSLFSILEGKLSRYFQTEWEDRTEEDRLVVERIILLLRYILSISSSVNDEKRTALESNTHDRVILAFLNSGIQQIFLRIATERQEKDFHLSVLEIICYIVKEHNPDDIVSSAQGLSHEQKQMNEQELREVFEREQNKISESKKKMLASRHSRFAGTYWVNGLHRMNKENKFFTTKPVMDVSKVSFLDERKNKPRAPKNRSICNATENIHISSLELRLRLKNFSETVLNQGFNILMKNTKNMALDAHRTLTQKNADIHYFLLMRYFLRFCRLSKLSPKIVDSCLGIDSFHTLQTKIDTYLENAAMQKKEGRPEGVRAQFAVTAYKELILFTQYMVELGSGDDKENARAVCKHILNIEEYRELSISILKKFQPATVSKTFLQEVVLSTHYYIKMLENSVKSGDLRSVLKKQKKKKIRNHKKGKITTGKITKPSCDMWTEERLDLVWAKSCEELSDVVMGHIEATDDQLPINSMLDATDEEHQQFAMLRIQRLLREQKSAEAVGLYRACREVWCMDDIFGTPDMDVEEEFNELRNIFYTDLKEIANKMFDVEEKSEKRFDSSDVFTGHNSDEESSEESDYETKEVEFNFDTYVVRFGAADIIKWYLYLLNDFDKNSIELNKALVKMLHRIAFDLKFHCKFFQLSLFRVLQRVHEKIVLLDAQEKKKSPYYELYTFGYHLLKRFFQKFSELGEKLAAEALFYKREKECYEIEYGYGSFETSQAGKDSGWSEDLEDDLQSLHREWRDMDERPEGMDLLDFIEANLPRARTRAQIQKKLKNLGLDTFGAKRTKGIDKSFPLLALKELVEKFNAVEDKAQLDLVAWLITSFNNQGHGPFSRKKIIKQLAFAGIIYEKKGSNKRKKGSNDPFIDDGDSDDDKLVGGSDDDLELLTDKLEDGLSPVASENETGTHIASPLMQTKTSSTDSPIKIPFGATKRKVIIDSDDEDGDIFKASRHVSSLPSEDDANIDLELTNGTMNKENEDSHKSFTKKRRRVISSDESEDDLGQPTAVQPTDSPMRKGRRVLIDSDEDE